MFLTILVFLELSVFDFKKLRTCFSRLFKQFQGFQEDFARKMRKKVICLIVGVFSDFCRVFQGFLRFVLGYFSCFPRFRFFVDPRCC